MVQGRFEYLDYRAVIEGPCGSCRLRRTTGMTVWGRLLFRCRLSDMTSSSLGAQSQCGVDYYVHIGYAWFIYYYNVLYNGRFLWNKPGHPAGQTPSICSWGSCRSHIELSGIMFSTEELPWKLQGLQRSEQSEHLLQLNSLLTWNSLRFTQTQHYLFKGITICYRQLNGFSVINLVVYCFKLWDFCKLGCSFMAKVLHPINDCSGLLST